MGGRSGTKQRILPVAPLRLEMVTPARRSLTPRPNCSSAQRLSSRLGNPAAGMRTTVYMLSYWPQGGGTPIPILRVVGANDGQQAIAFKECTSRRVGEKV